MPSSPSLETTEAATETAETESAQVSAMAVASIAAVAAAETLALVSAAIATLAVVNLAGALNCHAESAVATEGETLLSAELMLSTTGKIGERGNTSSAVLVALVAAVSILELLEVGVAGTDASDSLDISGVTSLISNATVVAIVMLVAEVVVVGTVVPCAEVVSPTAISPVSVVLVSEGVVSWGVVEGVAAESNNIADIARCVLVALVADTSLLLAVVLVVVARDGVQGHVDLARVVAPLVVNRLLGVPVVVGAPLVPGVVDPLVVALTLVAALSVRVVSINRALAELVAVVLVVSSEAHRSGLLWLDAVAMAISAIRTESVTTESVTAELESVTAESVTVAAVGLLFEPGVNGNNAESCNEGFVHFLSLNRLAKFNKLLL